MTFLNAGLLGLAALFAVPLIIHLLNKRRYQRVRWAAMDFLLKAYKQNRRKVRLQNLLLLLLRCLIPILLALAIARPRLGSDAALPVGQVGTHHILLLDRSASMGYRSGAGSSPFETMKRVSQALVDFVGNQENDKVSVVFFDEQVATPVRAELGVAGAKRALTSLDAPRDTVAHVVPAVREIFDLLEETEGRGVVYLFSDFQDNVLDTPIEVDAETAAQSGPAGQRPAGSSPVAGEGGSTARASEGGSTAPAREGADPRFRELADLLGDLREREVDVRLFPLAPNEAPQNSQVLDLRLSPQNAVARVGATLSADLLHRGSGARDVIARVSIDGKNPQTRRISLRNGERETVDFPLRFLEEGMHSVELAIEEDGLPVDDVRRLSVRVRDRIRVLLVEGRDPESATRANDDAVLQRSFLWDRLLDPTGGEGQEELLTFQTTIVDEDRFQADPSYFQGQDVIALIGVSGPRGNVAERLTQFVQSGGGLLIVPGQSSSADLYNSRLFGVAGEKGPLPLRLLDPRGFLGKLGNVAGGTIPSRYLTPRIEDMEHPLLSDFGADPTLAEILQRTPIYRYYAASLADKPESTELLISLAGAADPGAAVLLASRSFGRGQCVLLTSNISQRPGRWNRLDDLWVAFPLVHSIAHRLAAETPDRLNRLVGQTLSAWLPERPQGLWVLTPGSEQRSAIALPEVAALSGTLELGQRDPGFLTPPFGRTFTSGTYQLEAEFEGRTRASRTVPFAVNVDPSEGDLRYINAGQLGQELPMAQILTQLEFDEPEELATGTSELGRFVLLLVLIVGILESLLAGFVGGRRR
jgi:hypothetical protein